MVVDVLIVFGLVWVVLVNDYSGLGFGLGGSDLNGVVLLVCVFNFGFVDDMIFLLLLIFIVGFDVLECIN